MSIILQLDNMAYFQPFIMAPGLFHYPLKNLLNLVLTGDVNICKLVSCPI